VSFCMNATMYSKQPTGCCPKGLYCLTTGNSTSFTCVKDNSGSSCTIGKDCFASTFGTNYAVCMSGKCVIQYGAGDSCSANSDCFSNSCSSGVCTGVGLNGDCSSQPASARFVVCEPQLYCKTNISGSTCQATLGKGAKCTSVLSGGVPCPAGQWCTGDTCTTVGTVASGGNCSSVAMSNPFFAVTTDTFLCASGLAANVSSGTCVSGKTMTYTSCTNNTDCASIDPKSECICNPNGKGYCTVFINSTTSPDSTGVSEGVSLLNCLAQYNCSYEYMSPIGMLYANNDPNSCSVMHCNSYLKKFNSAGCNTEKIQGSCSYLPYCSGFPVWAIIVIVVVAILLVLAVVFVIFLVLRKRRDYSSI